MGRGTLVRALVLGASLVFVGGSVGCQALYGGKPEKLRNPERKRKPPEEAEKPIEVKYIDDCVANFRDDPKLVRPDTGKANMLVGDGDAALSQVGKAKDPASQAELIKQSIDKYRSALVKDPYHHEATLKLAVAYDMVYRKACAIALLKRITALESNPKFKSNAKRVADEVADNPSLFKGYRKDAVQAVGR
jgi:hypothetical protein